MSRQVTGRDLLPEFLTRRATSVTNDIRHDLTSGATQSNPHPAFVVLGQVLDLRARILFCHTALDGQPEDPN